MFKVEIETDKIAQAANMVNSVAHTLQTPLHINEAITVAHRLTSAAFILHMSSEAFSSPKEFAHMYEWGRAGDPNARLWKHYLRGAGASRVATFDFKASKTAVPVSPAKQAVGVQQNHIFVWKAPVLELGLPVRIRPKLARVLVIDAKGADRLIYTGKSIFIPRQGNPNVWGSFTNEFMTWFGSGAAQAVIESQLAPKVHQAVKQAVGVRSRQIGKMKTKSFKITPVGIDNAFVNTFNNSLRTNYIAAAANRRVAEDE